MNKVRKVTSKEVQRANELVDSGKIRSFYYAGLGFWRVNGMASKYYGESLTVALDKALKPLDTDGYN